jgi:glutaredoxin
LGKKPEPPQIFTPDEVVKLAAYQANDFWHPFTCPNRSDGNHRYVFGDVGALVPTTRGWICPFCDYTQNWAHSAMLEGGLDLKADVIVRLRGGQSFENEAYEPRQCDYCHRVYRGPSVYCSLTCAMADA